MKGTQRKIWNQIIYWQNHDQTSRRGQKPPENHNLKQGIDNSTIFSKNSGNTINTLQYDYVMITF